MHHALRSKPPAPASLPASAARSRRPRPALRLCPQGKRRSCRAVQGPVRFGEADGLNTDEKNCAVVRHQTPDLALIPSCEAARVSGCVPGLSDEMRGDCSWAFGVALGQTMFKSGSGERWGLVCALHPAETAPAKRTVLVNPPSVEYAQSDRHTWGPAEISVPLHHAGNTFLGAYPRTSVRRLLHGLRDGGPVAPWSDPAVPTLLSGARAPRPRGSIRRLEVSDTLFRLLTGHRLRLPPAF